jgi:phospholipid/cholesterol/gamma-HCH transport system permease protein
MRVWADYTTETDADGALTLAFSGPMVVASIGVIDRRLRELTGLVARIDLSGVDEIDTVGAWTASHFARQYGAEITGASDKAQRLIEAVSGAEALPEVGARRLPLIPRVLTGVGTVSYTHLRAHETM